MPSASIGCSPMACQDHRTEQPWGSMDVSTSDPLALNRVVPRLEAIRLAGVSEATWDRLERRNQGPRRGAPGPAGGGGATGDGPGRRKGGPRPCLIGGRRVGYRGRALLAWLGARFLAAGRGA